MKLERLMAITIILLNRKRVQAHELADQPYSCFSLMLLLQSFGFEPAEPNLERYQLNDKFHYNMMIPVVHETR